jgi:predicted deacylase
MDRRNFVKSVSGGAAVSAGALQETDTGALLGFSKHRGADSSTPPSKTFSYVTISKDTTGLVEMPVGIVEGGEGPTLTVTGGLMGTEYCGIEAASRIFKQTQPETLKGKLVVVPVVNLSSFQFRTPWFDLQNSVTPQDGKHINQHFPGAPDGTVTDRLAHALFEYIKVSDAHIDLRGGDLHESHLDHTIISVTGDAVEARSEELAKAFGHRFLLRRQSTTSQGTLIYETAQVGVPSIISESGLGYRKQPLEEFVLLHVRGIRNVMKSMGMIPGDLERPEYQKYIYDGARAIAPESGIFDAFLDQGEHIVSGQQLGEIRNLQGDTIAEVRSPTDGIIHEMLPNRLVHKGDMVFSIVTLGEDTGWVSG